MDSLRAMEVFTAVAETGSFLRAAGQLQMSAAQASQKVKQLEARLGVLLLNRSTRQVRLTEEGKTYYEMASAILQSVADAEAKIAELGASPQGRLRVEASVTLVDTVILPVLGAFRDRYPDISLEFIHADQLYGAMNPSCEVMLRLGPLADTGLIAHSLGRAPMGAFAAPSYLAAFGEPAKPEDLMRHRCINFLDPTTGAIHPWRFERGDEVVSITPPPGLAFNQGESRLAAGLLGLGVYRGMDLRLEEHIAAGRLRRILTDWTTDSPLIMICYQGGRTLSRRARCFVDHLRSCYGERDDFRDPRA